MKQILLVFLLIAIGCDKDKVYTYQIGDLVEATTRIETVHLVRPFIEPGEHGRVIRANPDATYMVQWEATLPVLHGHKGKLPVKSIATSNQIRLRQ